jgi:hypothetical protein
MRTCAKCDRPPAARGMCNSHYLKAKRAGLEPVERAKPLLRSDVEELARTGENAACVDCDGIPMFGGLRCLPCFQVRCEQRSKFKARVNT